MITLGFMGPTHLITGGVLAWKLFGISKVGVIITAIIASLAPDIDEPESLIGRTLFFLAFPINLIFGHRTITHSLLGTIGTTFLVYTISGESLDYTIAWAIGYSSHIILDSLSNMGTMLFWPYPKNFGLKLGPASGILEFMYLAFFIFLTSKYLF